MNNTDDSIYPQENDLNKESNVDKKEQALKKLAENYRQHLIREKIINDGIRETHSSFMQVFAAKDENYYINVGRPEDITDVLTAGATPEEIDETKRNVERDLSADVKAKVREKLQSDHRKYTLESRIIDDLDPTSSVESWPPEKKKVFESCFKYIARVKPKNINNARAAGFTEEEIEIMFQESEKADIKEKLLRDHRKFIFDSRFVSDLDPTSSIKSWPSDKRKVFDACVKYKTKIKPKNIEEASAAGFSQEEIQMMFEELEK